MKLAPFGNEYLLALHKHYKCTSSKKHKLWQNKSKTAKHWRETFRLVALDNSVAHNAWVEGILKTAVWQNRLYRELQFRSFCKLRCLLLFCSLALAKKSVKQLIWIFDLWEFFAVTTNECNNADCMFELR